MSLPATGTETPRPFVPARDFALSKRFYEALGFEKLLDDVGVAIFQVAPAASSCRTTTSSSGPTIS